MNSSVAKLLTPTGEAPKPRSKRSRARVTKKVAAAIKLMQTGKASSITDAAEQVGLSRPYLSSALRLPHVREYINQQVMGSLTVALLRSGERATELVDAASEHVSLDAVKHVQALGGFKVKDDRGPLVSLTLSSPGYIVDLSGNRSGDDAARPAPFSGSADIVIEGVANRDDHAARVIREGRPVPLPGPGENELERKRQNELRRLWVEDECRAMSADMGKKVKSV